MKFCPLPSSEELVFLITSSVLRYKGFKDHTNCCCPPPFLEDFLRYISPFSWSWPSICWSCRSLFECLSHQLPSQTFCELQQPKQHCSGVISSLMWPERLLWAFNADVTVSPWIAPPPSSYVWPTVLVLFLGMLCEAAFNGVPLFPSMISVSQEQDCPQRCFLAIWTFFIRPRAFLLPRRGPWV